MPSRDDFRQVLRAQMQRGIKRGATQLVVNSAESPAEVLWDLPIR
jgi:hypothetical protein